ncbi:50S ribosomal protein L25/general stress protein Ctc [Nocardioides sp. Kera G14]|uniref:50S ribosomal protein L25/general stress protein Ctc n=1 Tax=Nocardioides sp. Kera G14 TaxID=2884264 RepID=UPI001D12BC79|nr:50S ribosomal protein L25/general stress protein Ctc [Nocardioides sp. Kera G14]UDY23004.1 50S ribosomal protein L25/general stress protein Ctc [Nocardioides sp. Kera G14]
MSTEQIIAETRTEFGKGAARRIRRENKIPAVVYGHGSEATHITLPGHETMMALRHHGTSAVLELVIDGKPQLALTKQVQVDSLRRLIEHVDFVAVKAGEKVTADVAVTIVGDTAPDTLPTLEAATISVEAEATHLPEGIEVNVDGLQAGTTITAAEVTLPAGVTLVTDAEHIVVHVGGAPTAAQVEAELEAAEAEVGIVHEESDAEIEAAAEAADADTEATEAE